MVFQTMRGFFNKEFIECVTPNKKAKGKAVLTRVLPPPLVLSVPADDKKKKKFVAPEPKKPQLEMDIECYRNYFLVKFRDSEGVLRSFEKVDDEGIELDRGMITGLIETYEIITFNGTRFDLPLLNYALAVKDCTNADLKKRADELIKDELAVWRFNEKYDLPELGVDCVDLSQLVPMMTSLKACGARLHCPTLRDLPYEESALLNLDQKHHVSKYCTNDLELTRILKDDLAEEIELRRALSERYGVDLRSMSDAQIAEAIIKAEVYQRKGWDVKKPRELHTTEFFYQLPDFITFRDPQLNAVLDILRADKFVAKPTNKGIRSPERLEKLEIKIGDQTYRMGIGGLHSTEKSAFHLADDEHSLWDWDVTSYYPTIILQCGLYPKAVGEVFLEIFEEIVTERVAAKKAGDKVKADSMKITANGSFGKFGSPYSVLYAPDLMIQVTLTGQLSLLMLIDMMTHQGIEAISGNTDGVVFRCRRRDEELMKAVIQRWEKRTGLTMESTQYAGLWSRDVNNYVAIGTDGKIKLKGCFGYGSRRKNPEYDVCTDAVVEYLRNGTPVDETIRACRDIRKFISVRRVDGGAVKGKEYLGRVVRWYYSTAESGTINYKRTGNKVAQSDGAKPIMVLPDEFPADVNYDWYAKKVIEMFY